MNQRVSLVASGWVPSTNVGPLFETLARWINGAFDASDWAAISHGLSSTDVDANLWFMYPVVGAITLEVSVARNAGADPVNVQIASADAIDRDLTIRISTAVELFNSYRIAHSPFVL